MKVNKIIKVFVMGESKCEQVFVIYGGGLGLTEIREVWRCKVMKGFEGEKEDLEMDA